MKTTAIRTNGARTALAAAAVVAGLVFASAAIAPAASAGGAAPVPVLEEATVLVAPIPGPTLALDRALRDGVQRILADSTVEPLGNETYTRAVSTPASHQALAATFATPGLRTAD